jgi:CBS domain-containing protein
MKIRDILTNKGTDVVTITPDVTVHSAVQVLVDNNIGAVVVLDGSTIAGILSERDILRLSAKDPAQLSGRTVSDVMTKKVVTGGPDDLIGHVMETMTSHRIRHLPIVEGGALAGILSIGDVVNALRSEVEGENRYMRDYIQGRA